MLRKLKLLYSTVKHLKSVQIKYQVLYRLKKPRSLAAYQKKYDKNGISLLSFERTPPVYKNWLGGYSFNFLNLVVDFKEGINWDFQEHGKLWNYNLQYANYLLQEDIEINTKVKVLNSLYSNLNDGCLELEPYPVSLRSINVIRFCCLNNIKDSTILGHLHGELDFLSKRLEYHLLGNHLLENVFALIMGGAFFSENNWIQKGREVLETQLNEQILADGGHFELSPMYHQIILFRLLELIDWYSKDPHKDQRFEGFLRSKAEIMCSWLEVMTFRNGSIPHFNDSAEGISYSTGWLLDYARLLKLTIKDCILSASGYRVFNKGSYECRVDCGQVGPSYQPGHAHSDALSFILYYRNKPLFVEKGTSTYQIGHRRSDERATSSHNTVVVNGESQSRVWGGFRVADRAKVQILNDKDDTLEAEHDGYQKHNLIHKRHLEFFDNNIVISDDLIGNDSIQKEFHLHLTPGLDLNLAGNIVEVDGSVEVIFNNHTSIRIESYEMADGYNQYKSGKKIVTTFVNRLTTGINFN